MNGIDSDAREGGVAVVAAARRGPEWVSDAGVLRAGMTVERKNNLCQAVMDVIPHSCRKNPDPDFLRQQY